MKAFTSSKKERLVSWSLAFAVTVLVLAFSEATLRWFEPKTRPRARPTSWAIVPERTWIEYHPRLGWFHQKNKEAILKKSEWAVPLRTNSIGLRGPREYQRQKPPGVTRIYALGDSFTFGFGLRDEETFPAQMEAMEPSLEVINLGVPGYGVDQFYLLLKEFGFEYHPEIVLIPVFPEDFWRATRAFTDAGYGKPYFVLKPDGTLDLKHIPVPQEKNFSVAQFPDLIRRGPVERLLFRSRLYRLLRRAVIRFAKLIGWEDPETSEEWILGRAILKEMATEIKKRGIRPILIIVPPERWIRGTLEPIRDSLLRFGEREKVEVLDLTPVFKKAAAQGPVEKFYIGEDHHWTREGNRLVAQTLIRYLKTTSHLS